MAKFGRLITQFINQVVDATAQWSFTTAEAPLASNSRRAISLHLQDADNHWHPYRMPDGSILRYNHDYLVARDANGDPDYSDPRFCPVVWQESTG